MPVDILQAMLMKYSVISILLMFASQLFLVNYSASQVNNRARYIYPNFSNIPLENSSSVFKQFLLQDNSTLLLIRIIGRNNAGKLTEVFTLQKLDSEGNVLWNKKIEGALTGHETSIENAILLSDESILITGSFANKIPTSNKTNRSKFFILKISSEGIIIWNKSYSLNTSPDQPNLLSGHTLFEMTNKNLILTVTHFINDISVAHATYRLAIKFSSNGTLIWSNQYRILDIDEQGHINPGIAEIDDNLLFYNNVASTCTDENDPDCLNYESFATIVMLNSQTGVIASSEKIMHNGISPPETLFGTKNDDHSFNTHKVFYKDTTIKLFNYFRRFTKDGNKCRIGFLLTLNKSLEAIDASEIKVNNFAINPNANKYMYVSLTNNFLPDGSLQIGFAAAKAKDFLGEIIKEDSLRYFFTKITGNHHLQWQKKATVFAPGSQAASAPSLLETENCNTQIVFGYVNRNEQTNGKFNIELLRFNPLLNYNTNCFTTDTNFIEIKNVAVENADLNYNEQLNGNLIVPGTALFSLTDMSIPIKQIICELTNDCSNTKISGPDTACTNTPFRLSIRKNSNCYSPVEWIIPQQLADTTHVNDSTLQVNFKQPWQGKIYLKTTGCDSALLDSLLVEIIQKPVEPELGKDTMLCNSIAIPLKAGGGFKNYLWNTGALDSTIYVSTPGIYKVRVVDFCNNIFQDSITVKQQDFLLLINNGNISICKGDTITLSASFGFFDYTWNPAIFIKNSLAREADVFPAVTTTYSVKAKKFAGCELEEFVTVKVEECSETVFIPNSFTPNADGLNDEFKPIVQGSLIAYEFLVYNRFGEMVFHSIQKNKGWDGVFRNNRQPAGLYTWSVRYQFKNKKAVSRKGSVTLIR